jgi:hypothetical protein
MTNGNEPEHVCPGGCGRRHINHGRLACRECWHRLPRPLRYAVILAWRGGAGLGTVKHRDAIDAALAWYRTNPPATTR